MMHDVVPSASFSAPTLPLETLPRLLARPDSLARALSKVAHSDLVARSKAPTGDGEPYGRRVLHRDGGGEVVLTMWSGRERCAPHDHGTSQGALFVVEGEFRETVYRMQSGLLEAVTQRVLTPGAVLTMRREEIHGLEPLGPGITLHVYAPPVSCMRVFERDPRDGASPTGTCGAWMPRDVRLTTAGTCASALAR
jgi:cysteine dioxygenase